MEKLWTKIKEFFKKYTYMKWLAPVLAAVVLTGTVAMAIVLPSCASGDKRNAAATKLSFKSAAEYDYLKTLDGDLVTINGYMATSSPIDGSFIFLMNMPYQSCPFCLPNTSTLSNTIEVYSKKGKPFEYTTQAIKIVGTLVVAEKEDEPFQDEYGYEFNYKIVDATYSILKSEEMSADLALWQKVAESGIINKIDEMYSFVHFTCAWNVYWVNPYYGSDGELYSGYYLWASDAKNALFLEGAQWNSCVQEGYFDNLMAELIEMDATLFKPIVENIPRAEALSKKAIAELEAGNYTWEYKYVEKFGTYDDIYTLNIGDELLTEYASLYSVFSNWLASWEM